ncbi:MAG: oxidoreductase [Acidimicrobiales bacterium]
MEERPSVYGFVGRSEAFFALATALNDRCLADLELSHPFSHSDQDPDHVRHLAAYLAEVFGGPPIYTALGGHSVMLEMHAGSGAGHDLATRFLACFDQAIDDAGFPDDPELRRVLHDYMAYATQEVDDLSPVGMRAPENLAMPLWSWDGKVDSTDELSN